MPDDVYSQCSLGFVCSFLLFALVVVRWLGLVAYRWLACQRAGALP